MSDTTFLAPEPEDDINVCIYVLIANIISLLGVGYMMTILGVALGYIVGGQLLNIYVDMDQLQE